MAKAVIIDELHLTVRIPVGLSREQAKAVRDSLLGADFMARLRRAVRTTFRAFPELVKVRVSLTR